MAATSTQGFPLLDQLQNELNRVLEQTGRIFAASNQENKPVPLAQATRLKQILPGSVDRFHQALDQLEDELQTAQRAMRRELAAIHKRDEVTKPAVIPASAFEDASVESKTVAKEEPQQPEKTETPQAAEDVSMVDAETDLPAVAMPEEPPEVDVFEEIPIEEAPKDDTFAPEPPAKPTPPAEPTQSDQKAAEAPLQIDTQPQPKTDAAEPSQPPDEEKQPDTGTFSNANDFESLFGAPTSAGVGDGPDFTVDDQNNNDDFDFGSFGNDADTNINDDDNSLSALLPGLQDYANTQPGVGADTDFDALFSADMPGATDSQAQGEGGAVELDDFMDFGDFGDGNFTGRSADNNNNNNEDFDFSFD